MFLESLYHTYQRQKTLRTNKISSLPIVILMPHSACNCRCVMCDIWKDNKNLKQITEQDLEGLLATLNKLGTKLVLMSGGEALLNNNFFKLCEILKNENIAVTLLSTGLLLKKHADNILSLVNDVIISLDGDEATHNIIRNIPNAYSQLYEGVQFLRSKKPAYRITGRTVIHKLNFRVWPQIILSAKEMGLKQISFLPADISSHAFNREIAWSEDKRQEVMLSKEELPELKNIIDCLLNEFKADFDACFIAESPEKIRNIYTHYCALHGLNTFPIKKCNAPWVSTVIEADGTVSPCFFHKSQGNIKTDSLNNIINSKSAIEFRKNLDIDKDDTCKKCVCYLNLSHTTNPVIN
jgi:MoaA/NifB/PqqE/SkfB family radical SAM enzyme